MSGISKKLMGTTAVGGEALAIEDVFSTYLYAGTGSAQTITNGIDLAGEGGLVWIKSRANLGGTREHVLNDTERGAGLDLHSNSTAAEVDRSAFALTSFTSSGFTLGSGGYVNYSGDSLSSWSFRKAPRFFDVVEFTYTGSGQISHNLGCKIGAIIMKRTDAAQDWLGWYYRGPSAASGYYLSLNTSEANAGARIDTEHTDTYFNPAYVRGSNSGGTVSPVSGGTYVAYLFAHDPLGPSGDGSDGLIACGSFTTDGSGNIGPVELGWEPQFVLFKSTTNASNWFIYDTTRGMSLFVQSYLSPNTSTVEGVLSGSYIYPTSTGFDGSGNLIGTNQTCVYIAIRRGPMRQPTSGDEVFTPVAYTSDNTDNRLIDTGILTDAVILKSLNAVSNENPAMASRHTHNRWLKTNTTDAEIFDVDGLMSPVSGTGYSPFSAMNGFGVGNDSVADFNYTLTQTMIAYAFKRAPGFFDVVAYTGTGVARTVQHSLGVAPEMYWVRTRSGTGSWWCYHSAGGATKGIRLNSTGGFDTNTVYFNDTEPTDTVFSVGTWGDTNASGENFIAYLFASCPGVSKVGSYTGNGTNQTINCGFTTGARFILIKRTDSAGDWYVWDTARGIVAGNDPYFLLNSNAVEVTTDDSVDPDSSGFIVNQVAATNINVSSATYIFLAIA